MSPQERRRAAAIGGKMIRHMSVSPAGYDKFPRRCPDCGKRAEDMNHLCTLWDVRLTLHRLRTRLEDARRRFANDESASDILEDLL
jgi:transposase